MEQIISRLIKINPWTNVYGLSRSALACGTLATLLFNDVNTLFPEVTNRFVLTDTVPGNMDLISLFRLVGATNIVYAKAFAIIILLAVIWGRYPRYTGVLHWWVAFSFFVSSPVIDGGDQLTSIVTLLLVPVTLLDMRSSHWHKASPQARGDVARMIANSCLFVVQLQVSIVYFQAAFAKFAVPEWSNGTAVYYWFTHNTFGAHRYLAPIIDPIIRNNFGVSLLTWGVLLLEVLLFCAIFMQRSTQRYFLRLAIGFHFAILVVHGLLSFFCSISGALILYLWPVDRPFVFSRSWLRPIKRAEAEPLENTGQAAAPNG